MLLSRISLRDRSIGTRRLLNMHNLLAIRYLTLPWLLADLSSIIGSVGLQLLNIWFGHPFDLLVGSGGLLRVVDDVHLLCGIFLHVHHFSAV